MAYFWSYVRHPRRQMRTIETRQRAGTYIPVIAWLCFAGIAIGGSLVYGASLSLLLPGWQPARSAAWLALSAGLSWCIFGPMLILITRRGIVVCAHACLVTMVYGEMVLVAGAGANGLFRLLSGAAVTVPATWNFAVVGIANLVMAAMLARQLAALAVPIWKTLLVWMAVLNGSGVALFQLFQHIFRG